MTDLSLQDQAAPGGVCYGCGSSNPHGLHLKSHWDAEQRGLESLPRIECVTGHLGIRFIKPTPMGVPLQLRAWVEGEVARKSRVICELYSGGVMTACGDSTFVRVEAAALGAQAHGR
jgi:hypothetical protein